MILHTADAGLPHCRRPIPRNPDRSIVSLQYRFFAYFTAFLHWARCIALNVTIIVYCRVWKMCRGVIIAYYKDSNATLACSQTTKSLGQIICPLSEIEFVTSEIWSGAVITTQWRVKTHGPLVLKVIAFKIADCRPWCIIPLVNCVVSSVHMCWLYLWLLDPRVLKARSKRWSVFSKAYNYNFWRQASQYRWKA